jgi:phosphoribosylpyrophosphate synthetase
MQSPKAHRKPWSIGFPDVWIHADELAVKRHPHYALAKSGDTDHAALLVNELINVNIIQKMRSLQSFSPILISVHAEEEMGKNAIPEVMADVLSAELGWPTEPDVVQANVVNHTGADGFSRIARQAVFAGDIVAGCNYVIVDDFIGQGGTVANLRGHIENLGGTVLAATVLTGKPFSAKLSLSASQLA